MPFKNSSFRMSYLQLTHLPGVEKEVIFFSQFCEITELFAFWASEWVLLLHQFLYSFLLLNSQLNPIDRHCFQNTIQDHSVLYICLVLIKLMLFQLLFLKDNDLINFKCFYVKISSPNFFYSTLYVFFLCFSF